MLNVVPVADQNALLQTLLASSGDCIKILDLDGNLLYMTETGKKIMEVTDFGSIQGCPWPSFWQGQSNADAHAAVLAAREGRTGHFVGPASTMAGTPKYWEVTVTLIRDAKGQPDKLLSVSRDISTSYDTERIIREQRERLGLALSAADIGTWDLDVQSGVLTWDDRCYALFGLSPGAPISYARFLEGLHPDDRDKTDRACVDAMRPDGERSYDIEYRTVGLEDGIERWCSAKGQAFFAGDQCVRFIGTIRDIGDLKLAEQQAALLTHELEHRLKNTLAMINAIATQTFRSAQTKEDAGKIFESRLMALNRANNVLTKSSWTRASMPTVVEEALHMHHSQERRIRISGPPIDLSARQAMSLSLALHELATNAAKYGALSAQNGTVDVHWQVKPVPSKGRLLSFRWAERGGPPVSPPARKGFGSRLIASALASDFGPSAKLDYAPTGVTCSFETLITDQGET